MRLIGTFQDPGYLALADAVLGFYARRSDLQRRGVAFGDGPGEQSPAKVSTDISLVAFDRQDAEAHGLSEVVIRGVSAGLRRWLAERPQFLECCPDRSLFVNPLFNLQHYGPGEGFAAWHCDWNTSDEATEPIRRVLAWILYCAPFLAVALNFSGRSIASPPKKAPWLSFRPVSPTFIVARSATTTAKQSPRAGSTPAPWRLTNSDCSKLRDSFPCRRAC
jgi:hypothetical protein